MAKSEFGTGSNETFLPINGVERLGIDFKQIGKVGYFSDNFKGRDKMKIV